jgi:hypothetical protein
VVRVHSEGASWRHPLGPDSDVLANVDGQWVLRPDQARMPAVHLSWNDAVAFCGWQVIACCPCDVMGPLTMYRVLCRVNVCPRRWNGK